MRRLVLVIVVAASVACSSPRPAASPAVPTAATSDTLAPASPAGVSNPAPAAGVAQTEPSAAAPTAEVVYLLTAPSVRLFRVVVAVTNPAAQARDGIETRWEAVDATGAVVGSSTKLHPPLGPGSMYHYVGGAGNVTLASMPTSVRVTLTNPGVLTNAASRFLAVDTITLTKSQSPLYTDLDDYAVSAMISTGAETIDRANMTTSYILRDQSGGIVGADFSSLVRSLPEQLMPGNRYQLAERVPATGPAVSAEVTSYRRS